jgi:hypothetical protein
MRSFEIFRSMNSQESGIQMRYGYNIFMTRNGNDHAQKTKDMAKVYLASLSIYPSES